MIDRRQLFGATGAVAAAPLLAVSGQAQTRPQATPVPVWAPGIEGQRRADLGDGTFLNPIVAGDHPDPTVLKDGDTYYMTFSSFLSYPGLVIWRSTDLVNWAPVGPALHRNLGDIWAVDLCKHGDRYFIYIPANPTGGGWSIYVIWADDIAGPWSDPVDLGIRGCIDPGHIVGEDGKRYLFVNGIRKIRLTEDGLATEGALEPAYDPWRYPDEWITENFAPEGPKLLRRGEWFYLVTAVGGTAGPVTGHMVIAARSKSVHGPWEHCPNNPLVRTLSTDEPWWSRGHATLIEGPAGDWWMIYHGYENGFRTLGRQTLLEPIEWTADGWFRALGGDLSRPMPKPRGGRPSPAGTPLSDDFSADRMGTQWSFHQPGENETRRMRRVPDGLRLAGAGTSPADSSPLACLAGDRDYTVEIGLRLEGRAEAGLLLFYNHKAFVGVSFNGRALRSWQYAETQDWADVPLTADHVRLRIENRGNVITYRYSTDDGASWRRHPTRMEVSGLNHNVFGGFLSLRPAIFCTGEGAVVLDRFRYTAGATA